ncbi:MAG: hypothetical protein ACOZNI_20515 [Myxococcota bacterium]
MIHERRAAALLCFAIAAVLGYAAHRAFFAIGEPDPRAVGPSVHTPYYWRVATATWWGSLAAAGGWRFPEVEPIATRALPWAVGVATAIAVLIP